MASLNNILSLNSAGIPQDLISYEKAAFYAAKDLIAWSLGPKFTLHGGIQRSTGLQSTLDIDTIIAIKGKAHNKQPIPKLTNNTLFRRDMNLCAYCGYKFNNSQLSRDHIIPKAQRGLNNWNNVVTSCGSCNKHKGARTPVQANMELLYFPYVPCRNEIILLKYNNILLDQTEYLLKHIKTKNTRIKQIIKKVIND